MSARILIVDDVPANNRLLEAQLSAEYYQVTVASDGRQAIALALSWQPDLILLDVMMPDMDGYETIRRLKQDARTLHIPVVMITALSKANERLRGLEAGADDFLSKPVDFETLLARVRSLVRLKRLLDEWRMRGETSRALGVANERFGLPSVSGARTLVIDADPEAAQVVQNALARDNIVTGRASGAAEALALTGAIGFDLIVLSLFTPPGAAPEADPLRLASKLRASDRTHDIPMLLIAAAEQRMLILRGFDMGANDWLLQPLDENELRARARNQIRRKFYQDRLRADVSHALDMALTDPLTGFYNQRYLMRHLAGLLGNGPPQGGPPNGIAVMMIDVDHFKSINDRWGHPVGDRALRQIADTLRSRVRIFDSIARYGGEEFTVVMPGTDAQEAMHAAERLRSAIEAMVFHPDVGVPYPITVSIGVCCSDGGPMTAEQLLRDADRALYRAKHAGRNQTALALAA